MSGTSFCMKVSVVSSSFYKMGSDKRQQFPCEGQRRSLMNDIFFYLHEDLHVCIIDDTVNKIFLY